MPIARPDQTPVVLLHGWGGSYRSTWQASGLERELKAAGRPIVAADLPGHGSGPHSHDPRDYEAIADAAAQQWNGSATVDAVGFSLGGKILLNLAARRRARLRRVVVAGVGSNLFRPENGSLIAEALLGTGDAAAYGPVAEIVAAARQSNNDLRALAAVIQRPPSLTLRDRLAGVDTEILLVAGREDRFIGDANALHTAVGGASLLWLEGVDHLGTTGSPAFQKAASLFLLHGRVLPAAG